MSAPVPPPGVNPGRGPVIGTIAMMRLRSLPEAAALAGGKR